MKPVTIHSAARAELEKAMKWYENQVAGLGLDLEAQVRKAMATLQHNPQLYSPYKKSSFRKQQVRRFPYHFLS